MAKAEVTRRVALEIMGGTLAALGIAPGAFADSRRKPNIIFIMADDLGYADLSITGSRHIETPTIDRLAREGLLLTQGYSSTPICSPTRTALLTGCYAQRFEVGLEEPLLRTGKDGPGFPNGQPTIASVLKDEGYHTKLIGKWHLGEPPLHGPLQHGYDSFLGIVEGAADYFRHNMVVGGKDVGIGLARDNKALETTGYLTDLLGDEAVRTIEGAGDKPFFVSLHFTAPHWPWEGREDAALAKMLNHSRHDDGGSLAKYKELVELMDENIARVLIALERTGKSEDTIVVFTSDNGGERFSDTWPFIGRKGEVLEGGIRVPLIVRWPARITAGQRSDQVMCSMDFLPTLLTMAGGKPSSAGTFDGMDLAAHLANGAPPQERTLFFRFKSNEQAAVRQGDWKFVRIAGKEQLFDLSSDVHERANRSADHPEILIRLRNAWDDWNRTMLPYRVSGFSENLESHYIDRY